jgi:hypothetical protein
MKMVQKPEMSWLRTLDESRGERVHQRPVQNPGGMDERRPLRDIRERKLGITPHIGRFDPSSTNCGRGASVSLDRLRELTNPRIYIA